MKFKELTAKDDKALAKLLTETQAKMVKDRFAIAGKELTNVAEINKSRKLVAKINTILRQREILAIEKAIEKNKEKTASPKAKKGDE